MTDEERAREIIRTLCGASAAASKINVAFVEAHLAGARADKHDTGDMQREDMEARRIAAAIRAMGDKG